jgi:hypothetical protein
MFKLQELTLQLSLTEAWLIPHLLMQLMEDSRVGQS